MKRGLSIAVEKKNNMDLFYSLTKKQKNKTAQHRLQRAVALLLRAGAICKNMQ